MLNVQLEPEKVYEAIKEGVDQAIWRMITNGTAMPSRDFYDSVQEGIKEALIEVARQRDNADVLAK